MPEKYLVQRWSGKGIYPFRQLEYQVILELSEYFPVVILCRVTKKYGILTDMSLRLSS